MSWFQAFNINVRSFSADVDVENSVVEPFVYFVRSGVRLVQAFFGRVLAQEDVTAGVKFLVTESFCFVMVSDRCWF